MHKLIRSLVICMVSLGYFTSLVQAQSHKRMISVPAINNWVVYAHGETAHPGVRGRKWVNDKMGIVGPADHTYADQDYDGVYKKVEIKAWLKGATTKMQFQWLQSLKDTREWHSPSQIPNDVSTVIDWAPDQNGEASYGNSLGKITSSTEKYLYLWDSPGMGTNLYPTNSDDFIARLYQFRDTVRVEVSRNNWKSCIRAETMNQNTQAPKSAMSWHFHLLLDPDSSPGDPTSLPWRNQSD